MKKLLLRLKNWLQWHGYIPATTTLDTFADHFQLTNKEEELLKECVRLHLLKEYVSIAEDRSCAYIVVKVRDCIKFLRQYRQNIGDI